MSVQAQRQLTLQADGNKHASFFESHKYLNTNPGFKPFETRTKLIRKQIV